MNYTADGHKQTRGYRTVRGVGLCPVCGRDISLYADGTLYRHQSPTRKGWTCDGAHGVPADPAEG